MILDEKEVKSLLERTIAANPGRTMALGVSATETGSTRFANNVITTNGVYNKLNLGVQVYKGKKMGIVTANELNEDKIRDAVLRADALAEVAPENAELMPMLGPQTYPAVPPLHYPATAAITPDERAAAIISVVDKAKARNLEAAGFYETSSYASVSLNSLGQYYYATGSRAYYSNTLRGGTGSGWAGADEEDVAKLRTGELADRAVRKALESRNPQKLAPGKYTVVLEPAAVADFLWLLFYNFGAREADEGRSFLSLPEGKNRLGEALFSPKVTIYSDPAFPGMPAFPVGEDGLPVGRTAWVEKGVIKNLNYTRYWAQKSGHEPVAFPSNIIMEGGSGSVDDLVRSTDDGVLVSRLWYIRDLNPMILLMTGLTRDGVFRIKNGNVAHPVNNFRFNESPVNVLKNVVRMSKPVRALGGETGQSAFVPGLVVKGFNFSSVSEAV
jgi:predicted Zn-dependent protease